MLMNPGPEITSYAGIEYRVSLVCQNVDAVEFFHAAPACLSLRGAQRRSNLVGARDCFATLAMTRRSLRGAGRRGNLDRELQLVVEIAPFGIKAIDQIDLLSA